MTHSKADVHINYKNYRNMLSALLKKGKHNYYSHYLESNWNNIKDRGKELNLLNFEKYSISCSKSFMS